MGCTSGRTISSSSQPAKKIAKTRAPTACTLLTQARIDSESPPSEKSPVLGTGRDEKRLEVDLTKSSQSSLGSPERGERSLALDLAKSSQVVLGPSTPRSHYVKQGRNSDWEEDEARDNDMRNVIVGDAAFLAMLGCKM